MVAYVKPPVFADIETPPPDFAPGTADGRDSLDELGRAASPFVEIVEHAEDADRLDAC